MPSIAESHKAAIGCSKIAQALGLSRFGSRYNLWLQHTGREDPPDLSGDLRVALGEPMEDVMRPFVADLLGRDLRRDRSVYRHKSLPIIAHVDFRASKLNGERARPVVDMKTSLGFGAKHRFGEDGSDQVDDDVLLQMQGYTMLTGADVAYVAALVPGPHIKIYTIEADRELHEMIEDGVADYWRMVETDTPPDPQSEQEAKQRWPRHQAGKVLNATVEVGAQLRLLAQLRADMRALEAREKAVKDTLYPALADAEVVIYGGEEVATFRANRDSEKVDWRYIAEHVMEHHRVDDDEREMWLERGTRTVPGARVLRLAKSLEAA